jgi:hypothetical protein
LKRLVPFALLLAAPASAEIIGGCQFDRDTLTFAGSPVEQASCLLRKVKLLGAKEDQPLPPVIRQLLENGGAPTAAQKEAAMAAFPQPYQAYARQYADWPASKTEAGLPLLYFVIHDTSDPFYGADRFPKRLDTDHKVNAFAPYMDATFAKAPVAHIFLSRYGQIWAGHDFSEAWRATKLESRVIGGPARGRFVLHRPRPHLWTQAGLLQGPVPPARRALCLCQRAGRALADPGVPRNGRRPDPRRPRRSAEFRAGDVC